MACSSQKESELLDDLEPWVTSNVDSALYRLNSIPVPSGEETRARYDLFSVWIHYRNYDDDLDLAALENAYSYYKNKGNDLRKAQAYYLHAAVCELMKVGDEEQHSRDYLEAANAVEKTNDHVLAAQIYQRITNAMNARHIFHESLKWGEKYRDEAKKSGYGTEEVIALLQLAMAHCWHVDSIRQANDTNMVYEKSIELSREALGIAQRIRKPDYEVRATSKLSSFFGRSNILDSALFYAQRTEELQAMNDQKSDQRRAHLYLADAYRKMGEKYADENILHPSASAKAKALEMADSALKYINLDINHQDNAVRVSAHQLMYIVYRDVLHDNGRALRYMTKYNELKDSVQAAYQNEKVLTLPIKMEKAAVEANLSKTKHILWGSIGIFLIFIITASVINFSIRSKNKRMLEKLQDELNKALEKSKDNVPAPTPITTPEIAAPSKIRLEGTTNESLELEPCDLLSITSEGNYIKVSYIEHKKDKFGEEIEVVSTKMLRSTMKDIENQLESNKEIVRCHRAFLVNLSHISRISSTSAGLSLHIDSDNQAIPVSRSYVSKIKETLENR